MPIVCQTLDMAIHRQGRRKWEVNEEFRSGNAEFRVSEEWSRRAVKQAVRNAESCLEESGAGIMIQVRSMGRGLPQPGGLRLIKVERVEHAA